MLVPIGQSAERIMPYVKEFSQLFGSRVILLHVNAGAEDAGTRNQIRDRLNELARELQLDGVPVEVLEREGDPAYEILESCRQENTGIIAITTHRTSGMTRWALGGVTEKVLRSGTTPMLVVCHP